MKQFVAAFIAIASFAGVCAEAGKCVVTYTFDDGLADQYTIAYPMFRKAGLPATFFIIGSKVGDSRGMRSKACCAPQSSSIRSDRRPSSRL